MSQSIRICIAYSSYCADGIATWLIRTWAYSVLVNSDPIFFGPTQFEHRPLAKWDFFSLVNSDPQQFFFFGQFGPFPSVNSDLFHWSIRSLPVVSSDPFHKSWIFENLTEKKKKKDVESIQIQFLNANLRQTLLFKPHLKRQKGRFFQYLIWFAT